MTRSNPLAEMIDRMEKLGHILENWHNRVVFGKVPLDHTRLRFLLTVYFYGGICGLAASVSNFLLNLDPYLTYSATGMGILFLILHRSLFKEWIGYLAGVRLFYAITAFYFNTMWFANSGLDGGILIFFYLLVIVIMIYSDGWERGIYLTAIMTNLTILMILDYKFDNLSIPFPGKFERYMDVWFSIMISFIVNYIAISIVLKALNRSNSQLADKYETIQKDLELAKKIQLAIMSTQSEKEAYDFHAIYRPLSGVGGDLFSIDNITPTKVRIFLADATGHGVQSALVTMLILSEYFNNKLRIQEPGSLIEHLNDSFIRNYSDTRTIFSCVILDWNFATQKILYASAGHIPQLLLLGHKPYLLEKTGPIIGLKKGARYTQKEISLGSEPRLFLFSDGVTETFNPQEKMFGEERLVSIIQSIPWGVPMEQILEDIEIQLKLFAENSPIQDDFTILGIQPRKKLD